MRIAALIFFLIVFNCGNIFSQETDEQVKSDSSEIIGSVDSNSGVSETQLHDTDETVEDSDTEAMDSSHVYVYPAEDTISTSPALTTSNWKDLTKDLSYPKVKETRTELPSINLPWIKYVIYGIGILVTIFLLYNIIVLAMKPADKKIEENIDVTEIDPEILPVENLESLLKKSLDNGDLRNAIRFSYLITLKNLADKKLIVRTKDKTNFDYLNELSMYPLVNIFREITRAFELTWYGEIIPATEQYKRFETSYIKLNEAITTDNR